MSLESGALPDGSKGIQAARSSFVSKAKQFISEYFSPKAWKTNLVALKNLGFKHIASGAEKYVLEVPIPSSGVADPEKIYYAAVRYFVVSKEKQLRQEVAKMQDIAAACSQQGDSTENLAVNVKELTSGEKEALLGRNTKALILEAERANKDDLETAIQGTRLGFVQRLSLCADVLKGYKSLHNAGYVHGDPKTENVLVFENKGKLVAKISDFGKAEKIGDAQMAYSGTFRAAPPEGKASKEADIYGAALKLIRVLEEEVLGEDKMLVSPKNQKSAKPFDKRRGVERYVLAHKAFPAEEAYGGAAKLWRLRKYSKLDKTSAEKQAQQYTALNDYISELCTRLQKTGKLPPAGIAQLEDLLKRMVNTEPSSRPNMTSALSDFQKIMSLAS